MIWIKTHWKAILIISGLVLFGVLTITIFSSRSTKKIKDAWKASNDSYKQQIGVLKHEKEKHKQQDKKAMDQYIKEKSKIDVEYKKQGQTLIKKQQKELEKLVKEYREDPVGLTKKVAEQFGFQEVKVK